MIYVIANRLSGGGKGAACLKKAEEILSARGAKFKTLITEHAGHGAVLAKQACADICCRRIIAIGGDGTFSEILNGMDLSVPIAFVPAGTGNDFVKGAGLESNTEKAVHAALDGHVTLYDILSVNGKRCLNIAGTGFDVDVLLHEAKIRKVLPGKLSYTVALLRALAKLRFTDVKLTIDNDKHMVLSVFLLAAANGKYYGGGLPICLDASCNDGYIDLVIIKKLPRSAIPHILYKFFKGELKQVTEHVEIHRCKSLTFDTASSLPVNMDGELIDGLLPARIAVQEKRLQVMTF